MAVSDAAGAMRYVTPTTILKAAGLVRRGQVYPLAHVLESSMPHLMDAPGARPGNRFTVEPRTVERPELGTQVFVERISCDTHSGTHIDAFVHWSKDGKLYGGLTPTDVYTGDTIRQLGLDEATPLVTRGVLIDAAAHAGQEILPGGTVLQPEDLQGALDRQGVALAPGDALLVRTGWSRHWGSPALYMGEAPGLSRRAAEWVADQHVVAIGADQWVIDASPPERPEDWRACHEVFLVDRGVHIIENMQLEQLAADSVYEFLFTAAAPPLKGGTAFQIQPLAIA